MKLYVAAASDYPYCCEYKTTFPANGGKLVYCTSIVCRTSKANEWDYLTFVWVKFATVNRLSSKSRSVSGRLHCIVV